MKDKKRETRKVHKKKRKAREGSRSKEYFIDTICFIVSSLLISLSVNMFTAANNIAPGGVTGIATMINYLFPFLPIGVMIIVINIPLFILAFRHLGAKLFIKTAVITVLSSVTIDVLSPYITSYSGDKLLAALFGGFLSGVGYGLVFIRSATTGGTDIISRLVKKRYPHIPIGTLVLCFDMIIVAFSGLVYKNIESILYAVIVFFVSSRVVNYLLYGTGNAKMIQAVTTMADKIADEITTQTRRGVTVIPVKGGYTGEEKNMIICVVRAHEVANITKIIKSIDENPFIIISEANEIRGLGFKNIND